MLIAMGAAEALSPYIEFKDVSKAFGDRVVLQDVSFDVLPGEMVCILGRSGVGKSVALHNIMGFLKPDSGRVIVAGQDITGYNQEQLEEIHKKVTMVFQNGALFDSLTVGENVAFPLREKRELSEEQIYQVVDGLLEMVGVKEMRDQLPSDLSTGMKRSVAIARALAAQPECVLYDEPTTMVDPLMGNLLGDLIARLKLQLHLTSVVSRMTCAWPRNWPTASFSSTKAAQFSLDLTKIWRNRTSPSLKSSWNWTS